ncbi:hypothetical protein GF389_02190 [Candidatus Dojkabacteria bacterium]|nr:hypothetical protein [Candidatus Dojkabacteria bacterium]
MNARNANPVLETKRNNPKEAGQIDLGIKVNRFQPIVFIQRRLNRLERRIEVMPFWKNFGFVFMLFSTVAFNLIVELALIVNYDDFPFEIPFFYAPTESSWLFLEKGWLVLVPIVHTVLNLILLNVVYSIFQFDRRLAQIIGATIGTFNILYLLAFAQLLSIVTI